MGSANALLFVFTVVASAGSADEGLPADLAARLQREITTSASAKCPDPTAYSLTRPEAAAGPTVVGLGLFFQDLVGFSDVDQTLDMDVYVLARWRDPRLADPARGTASAECPIPVGRLWMPSWSRSGFEAARSSIPIGSSLTATGSSR
jgi:neurotransmitter-gated ion-channel